jgi:flagellar FliJ protein
VKRFEFSLDRLLKVKRQLERLAELEQRRAREAVDRARAVLDDLRAQLTRVSEQITASVGRPMAPHQWAAAADQSERLGQSIRVSEQEVEQAEQKLLAAAEQRAQIATEVEALDTLRRQQWEQWQQEAQKADQNRLDELGLRRWREARGEGGNSQAAP